MSGEGAHGRESPFSRLPLELTGQKGMRFGLLYNMMKYKSLPGQKEKSVTLLPLCRVQSFKETELSGIGEL